MSATGIDETHDPKLRSWVDSAAGHRDFPVQNLPFGVFAPRGRAPRIGVAIGDLILDLQACATAGLLPTEASQAAIAPALNPFMSLPGAIRRATRATLSRALCALDARPSLEPMLIPAVDCTMCLPATIGDYTDFYVGIHHATNVGRLFRPDNPLLANYKHVPIGYHGRASSVRPSGIPVIRPQGQSKAANAPLPVFGPTARLDYELELGVWIGCGNEAGSPIPIDEAHDHVAGYGLLNDWSARDLQAWEYQPLGPFLAKSFHTTVSPWVITPEALLPFRRPQSPRPATDPTPLPYLHAEEDARSGAFNIVLEVHIRTQLMRDQGLAPYRLSQSDSRAMYWTVAQMVSHHSANGCNLNPGDLLGTGTLSGPERSACGSLLELSAGGTEPVTLPNGEQRSFLEDGDEIALSARAQAAGYVSIGFGECQAIIAPSRL